MATRGLTVVLQLSGSDPNTSKRLEGTPAEKHNKAAQDSESKQARTAEQESHPVSLPYTKKSAWFFQSLLSMMKVSWLSCIGRKEKASPNRLLRLPRNTLKSTCTEEGCTCQQSNQDK